MKNKVPKYLGGSIRRFCGGCHHELAKDAVCGKNGKELKFCPCVDRIYYRSLVYEKNSGVRRSKKHNSLDPNEVKIENAIFTKSVKGKQFNRPIEAVRVIQESHKKENQRLTLLEACTFFLAYSAGERGAIYSRRERSKQYQKELKKAITLLFEALKSKGVNPETAYIDNFPESYVEAYHILLQSRYGPKSYNKHMGSIKQLFSYTKKNEGIDELKNPFQSVIKKRTKKDVRALEPSQVQKVLSVISKENGIQTLSDGTKKNHYAPYLSDAILLFYFTGGRREEVCNYRFNMIDTDENGVSVIIGKNYKVNKIQGITEEENQKVTPVPVTQQLKDLLNEMGYEQYKNTDRYILANDCGLDRKTLMNSVSKAFTHFAKIAKLPTGLSLRHCRKSYATAISNVLHNEAHKITGHSTNKTLDDFYIDRKLVARVATHKNLFPELNNLTGRKEELQKIRNDKYKEITRDI